MPTNAPDGLERLIPVIWDEWVTHFSKNTCERCTSLHGRLFRRGEGPQPPLHDECRCERRYHHTEFVRAGEES